MASLIVAWQDPEKRSWHAVGRLTKTSSLYEFVYTRGALSSKNFVPFSRMMDMKKTYSSHDLFPVFSNRIMAKSRPEYNDYLDWLGVNGGDPLMLLARSEGVRATDGLQLYPFPEKTVFDEYEVYFFCHGIRHVSEIGISRLVDLQHGERLYPLHDFQNDYDPDAIGLRTEGRSVFVGYAPSFLAKDFKRILTSRDGRKSGRITVEKVNSDAPLQLRLLCKITAPWPEKFIPFSGREFYSMAEK